ncbi:MAG TPA: hypothetical protein VLJ37_06570 [bacterium]|nr:hypothetical protein [bacterium]
MVIPPPAFPRIPLLPQAAPPQETALPCLPDGTAISTALVRADNSFSANSLILRKEILRPPPPPVLTGMGIGANFFAVLAFWDLVMGASGLLGAGVAVFAVCTSAGLAWELPRHARHKIASPVFQPRLKESK